VKRLALLLLCLLALVPAAARAGELDLTGDLSGFSSPDDVNGPWRTYTGTYRWQASLKDTPSVSLVTRYDGDRLAPTWSNGTVVDDYHDFDTKTFGYAAIGLAAGTVLPTRTFYIEGDRKFGPSLNTVFGAGVGVVVNPNGLVQRYINFGPTYYGYKFNVGVRYIQTFTTGRTGAGTGIFTFQAGETGKTIGTFEVVAGDQPPNGFASASAVAEIGQRVIQASLSVKKWIGKNGGILAGVDVERLNDRLSGDGLYARRGISLGVFRNIGPALP
jgi:YaiO family outer membrane protein